MTKHRRGVQPFRKSERDDDIRSPRLLLRLMGRDVLRATVESNLDRVESLLGLHVPEEWLALQWLAAMRLEQERRDPAFRSWSIRAVALAETLEMVGYLNCHAPPHDGSIELGYEIFPGFRRKGFAEEAVRTFLNHTTAPGGIAVVRLSIRPDNEASQAMARKLGARKVGTHIDEVDGLEDIYLLDAAPLGLR
ncbi:MAG: GNAT family N-acetyltransferase [Hyphomicrobiales bacterium]